MSDNMPDFDWYAVGDFDDLQQGDLFSNCPVAFPHPMVYQRLLAEVTGTGVCALLHARWSAA
jgi:hypothetical protein